MDIVQINTLDEWVSNLYSNNMLKPILGYQSKSINLITKELKYNLMDNLKQKNIK